MRYAAIYYRNCDDPHCFCKKPKYRKYVRRVTRRRIKEDMKKDIKEFYYK